MDSIKLKELTIQLNLIEADIKEASNAVKELKAEKAQVERVLIEALQDNGGMGCSWEDVGYRIGLKTLVVPTVKDWESTLECIITNDLYYLLQHSIKSEGWRELQAQGVEIDGVTAFEKITLSKTKYSK